MKPNTIVATTSRPNRILVALAAAWMIASLAIGGFVSPPAQASLAQSAPITSTTQP